jgi:hypothetical protein
MVSKYYTLIIKKIAQNGIQDSALVLPHNFWPVTFTLLIHSGPFLSGQILTPFHKEQADICATFVHGCVFWRFECDIGNRTNAI